MSTGKMVHIAKKKKEMNGYIGALPSDRVHCYCDAWGLEYPHYMAEHTADHEAAQALRAKLAAGTE